MFCFIKSAGPAKESKADKRKNEKKGSKGGGGAHRPVSGKPGNRASQTNTAFTDKTNLQLERNGKYLDSKNNEQSVKEHVNNGGNGANLPQTEAKEDNPANESERANEQSLLSPEEASNLEDAKSKDASIVEEEGSEKPTDEAAEVEVTGTELQKLFIWFDV